MDIQKGDLVEYCRNDRVRRNYTIGCGEARYGVATKDCDSSFVLLRDGGGLSLIPTYMVMAHGWDGYIPFGLEDAYNELNEE